jgi:spore coat protein SA
MIYHLLPEWEVFSTNRGGALAKDVANIMLFDPHTVVVCESADHTWGFAQDRILAIPGLRAYAKIPAKSYLPRSILWPFLRRVYQNLLSRLEEGDVIWCHNQPGILAALALPARLKNAKLIFHSHNPTGHHGGRVAFESFTPDAAIFVSASLRNQDSQHIPQLKSANAYVVHNGADEALFYPGSAGVDRNNASVTILYVGRLFSYKGVHVLMEAMRMLQERNVDAFCKVFGSFHAGGSKVSAYMRTLFKTKPSNVEFKGYRSAKEIAEEYRAADILCCPSIWQEPFGNVLIEAMACGIPVVATRVGGIPEIATEGGVQLVEPNSAVELANALQKLIEDKRLRKKMAAEGLQSFQRRFTWANINKQYQEIADSLNADVAAEVNAEVVQ